MDGHNFDVMYGVAILVASILAMSVVIPAGATVTTIVNITGSGTCGRAPYFCGTAGPATVSFVAHSNGAMPGGSFSGTVGGSSVAGVFSVTNTSPAVLGLPCASNLTPDIGLQGQVTSGSFQGQIATVFGCAGPGRAASNVPVGLFIQPSLGSAFTVLVAGTGTVVAQ